MTDVRLPVSSSSPERHVYRIMRKGSRYNILGPSGRIFTKYQSASTAGPRWEELTGTPWPYDSTAYERGQRLWELGLIQRDQVGKRNIPVEQPRAQVPAAKATNKKRSRPKVASVVIALPAPVLALPAPTIDLQQQTRLMQALKANPALIFNPKVQQALRHEVEYHRPQARWAAHLLRLLARYERRQQKQLRGTSSATITARHIAWQEQRVGLAVAP